MMMELIPQASSKNLLSCTQTIPSCSPLDHPITVSTDHHKTSLNSILHPQSNDDEATPLPETAKQADKPPLSARNQEQYQVEDLSSKKKSSLKSKCIYMKSRISESTMRKFCGAFVLVVALVNLAIIIPFAVYYFRNKITPFIAVNGALSYIAFSLSTDPILDIQPGPSCPAGYYSLLLGTWPGTTYGCECADYLRSGECHKSGRGANEGSCTDIDAIDPIRLYEWGTSEWCVLKAEPGSQYERAAKCGQGFKKCSSGICVLDTLDCPVTKIEMTAGTISTEKVVGDLPVIGFAITPNDIPCFSDNHFASGPIAPYELIDENEDGCGKYGADDQYSFALGKQKQKDIFSQNDFPKKVYSLPNYAKTYKKTDSVLSYRRRMSVAEKDVCLNIDVELLERPSSVTKDLKRFLEGTLIAALFIQGLSILVVVIFLLIEICVRTPFCDALQGEGEEHTKVWIGFYFFGAFLGFINFVVMFAATLHFRAKLIEVKDYLADLVEAGCFLDLQAMAAVSDYQNVVDVVAGNYFRYSLSVFLIGTLALFSCIYLLCKLSKK